MRIRQNANGSVPQLANGSVQRWSGPTPCCCGEGYACFSHDCLCTIPATGQDNTRHRCFQCSTDDAEVEVKVKEWLLRSVGCVVNSVPEIGMVALEAEIVETSDPMTIASYSPAMGAVASKVDRASPTTEAVASTFNWIPDETLKAATDVIANEVATINVDPQFVYTPEPEEPPPYPEHDPCFPSGWDNDQVGVMLSNETWEEMTRGRRRNGWHIGFGYAPTDPVVTADEAFYIKGGYHFYPAKPTATPLVPDIAYIYGALIVDTEVEDLLHNYGEGGASQEAATVCVKARATLYGAFYLGTVPGSPTVHRFAYYQAVIFKTDYAEQHAQTSFCAGDPICLDDSRPEGGNRFDPYFNDGRACLSLYKGAHWYCDRRGSLSLPPEADGGSNGASAGWHTFNTATLTVTEPNAFRVVPITPFSFMDEVVELSRSNTDTETYGGDFFDTDFGPGITCRVTITDGDGGDCADVGDIYDSDGASPIDSLLRSNYPNANTLPGDPSYTVYAYSVPRGGTLVATYSGYRRTVWISTVDGLEGGIIYQTLHNADGSMTIEVGSGSGTAVKTSLCPSWTTIGERWYAKTEAILDDAAVFADTLSPNAGGHVSETWDRIDPITEFAAERLLTLAGCDDCSCPDCATAEDIYSLEVQCTVGTNPSGWSDLSLSREGSECVWTDSDATYSAVMTWADGDWTLIVTRISDSETMLTATWTATGSDPTGTHYFTGSSAWDEDCGALAAIVT